MTAFFTTLGLQLILLLRFLPLRYLRYLGAGLGLLLYYAVAERRKVTLINLRRCFPHLSEATHRQLARQHFRAFISSLLDRVWLWHSASSTVSQRIHVTGWHHLSNHQHRPIIVLAPHFLGMDAAGVWLSRYFPLMTVYSQQKNAVINAWCKQGRNRWMPTEYQARIIPRQAGLRPVLKGLKAHYPFYYLPDMDFGARDAVFVDFFGTPAATVHALPRLVSATDAMVVPVIARLTPTGYHIDILPPWQNYPDPDLNDAVRRLNQMLEDEIRRDPIQYLWTHKRFKTRPPNEPSLYE